MFEGSTVLWIDDDPEYLELAAGFAEANVPDLTIHCESDPPSAIEILQAQRIDCVVCDYEMPHMSGLDILEQVRSIDSLLPVIFVTGEGSETVASKAISAGVSEYLLKGGPDHFATVLECVDEAVGEYQRERFVESAHERPVEVIERVTDAFFALDREWRFTYLNAAAEELLGRPAETLLGATVWEEFPEITDTAFYDAFHASIDKNEPQSVRARLDAWDRWFSAHLYPSKAGISVIAHDITEQKKQEDALRHQRDQLHEFASILSHDLRNPLNVAMGRLELAADDCDSPHLEDVDRSLYRIKAIIEDLLALAREGEMVTQIAPIDVLTVVEDAWRNVETESAELRIDTDLHLYADEAQLIRLFENLFRNAIEHGGDDVLVRVGKLEEGHGFYVADDGPGIPEEERESILERGFSRSEEGTGLGLSIVQRIAEAHDWEIAVGESKEGGARIEIRFD